MIPTFLYPLIVAIVAAIVLPLAIRLIKPKYFRWYQIPVLFVVFVSLVIGWMWLQSNVPIPNNPKRYIRLIEDGGIFKLQAGSQTFINESTGDTVTLFGICHIGDSVFYETLLDKLSTYKTVIFEGVAIQQDIPEDTPAAQDSTAKAKTKKKIKKKVLDIDHGKPAKLLALKEQSDYISNNYQGWLWCDVTSEQIEEELKKRQAKTTPEAPKNTPEIKVKPKATAKKLMGAKDIFQLLTALNDDPQYQRVLLKRYLSHQDIVKCKRFFTFFNMVNSMSKEQTQKSLFNEIILEFRNQFLFEKLDLYLLDPELQDIAVLYGAAHLTGLEVMLTKKGFKRQDEMKWITITEF